MLLLLGLEFNYNFRFMKKLFFYIILNSTFFLLNSFCYAQNAKIDSLLILLKTDKSDTNKVNHLNQLTRECELKGYFDNGLNYGKDALELSSKLNCKKGIANASNNVGNIHLAQGNYFDALKNYFASLKIRYALGEKQSIASSYNNIGNVYNNQGNYQEAMKNYFAAIRIFEEIKDKPHIAMVYNNIGNIYLYQGNYSDALKKHLSALKIEDAIADKQGIADSYNNIGAIYMLQNNFPEALKNHFASLKMREDIGDNYGIATSYNNIGIVYEKRNNYSDALKNYFSSLKIFEALGDKKNIAASYNNIAIVYGHQGKSLEALKNHFASLKIEEEIADNAGIAKSYFNIGVFFIKQKKYNEAEKYLIKAKSLSKEIGYKECSRDVYGALTSLDSANRNFKGAYANHKLYTLYRDSLDNEETRKKTIQTQMTYDFEKKEAVADAEHKKELEKQQAIAEEKSRKQRLIILFVICGLLLVLVFAGLIFRSLRITKKQKEIIEIQKEKVEVQNEEITNQKHLVEEKNHEISSSISYAKRIQRSFLTAPSLIKRHLPDHFILFKPRDVVSGDFYWMHQKDDYSYFFVADCTGHGIPGAFMSLIGMGVLNEIVFSKNIFDTNDILNELRRIVILAVNPEDATEEGKDGMDLVYLRIHHPTKELQYSSANNSFYICRNGELIEYKPDKMPVGSFGEYEKPFTQHTIQLEEGDIIYGITDGYADQFGGPKGKKFKYKQLEDILVTNAKLPMQHQSEILEARFNEWKGELEQVDDVTIVGIRV